MTHFNFKDISEQKTAWDNSVPFSHIVIDNFLPADIAEKVAKEFPDHDDVFWHEYSNPLEVKKTCNDWNKFGATTYRVFSDLCSEETLTKLSELVGKKLFSDPGLHGGGLHSHGPGGKLNTHLDYSIHPKVNKQRKLNIIIYVTKDWGPSWGGALGLWGHDEKTNQPKDLVKKVDSIFNRAVIFDTTMNSWHGLPDPIKCPEGKARRSLAIYYLVTPPENTDSRERVLFAPTEEQKGDPNIEALIQKRAESSTASSVYKQ